MGSKIWLMLLGVLLASVAQMLLKLGADHAVETDVQGLWHKLRTRYLTGYVIAGYTLLGISMLIPLYVYRFVELKFGAVMESMGYVFVMLLGAAVLGEKITKRKLLGNGLIVLGVILFGLNM